MFTKLFIALLLSMSQQAQEQPITAVSEFGTVTITVVPEGIYAGIDDVRAPRLSGRFYPSYNGNEVVLYDRFGAARISLCASDKIYYNLLNIRPARIRTDR